MTQLLQKAFESAAKLPQEEQDKFARFLLAELESERQWTELFSRSESEDLLEGLADEALAAHRAGRTQPGDEPLHSGGNPIRSGETVLNFWQWSASDLIDNTQRGALAEYIVALAVGTADDTRRPEWASYDIKTPDGIKVEVKSSAYIQSWAQKKESTPRFSIRQAFAWDPDTDTYSDEKIRDSDIYVFCLHKHRDEETLDLLDVSQWDYYILPTARLEHEAKGQKTIGLASLERLGARKASFGQIHDTLRDVLTTSKTP